tara:strand:- start:135 stop:353 length:219 start_codon:yes stop_codon:yes gene_type:complete
MIIKNNKRVRSVKQYRKDVQNQVHDKYRPIIDLVYKLYCVPSQADDTMKEIKVLLKEIGHVDTIDLKEVKNV